jgi:hypothetical protein
MAATAAAAAPSAGTPQPHSRSLHHSRARSTQDLLGHGPRHDLLQPLELPQLVLARTAGGAVKGHGPHLAGVELTVEEEPEQVLHLAARRGDHGQWQRLDTRLLRATHRKFRSLFCSFLRA